MVICIVIGLYFPAFSQHNVEKGILDLSNAKFESGETFELEGDWEFYWKSLIQPGEFDTSNISYRYFPQLWTSEDGLESYGYATYHLKILLPDDPSQLALTIPDFYSAYQMYVNGELFSNNGTVATNAEDYTPHWLPKTVALDQPENRTLDIVLQIANFDHSKGGSAQQITIGSADVLFKNREKETGYAYLLTGSLLMGGLFFLGLYLFGRHDTPILYFSLFCMVYSYRIIGFGIYALHPLIPDAPWILTLKLEYITLFLSPYLFGLYLRTLYPNETSKLLVDILSWISISCAVISLVFPPFYFTQLVLPFFAILSAYIFYAAWVYIKAVQNKRDGSQFALASTGVVFVVLLWNILQYIGVTKANLLFTFFGYLSFFFFQSLILSYRFASYLKKSKLRAEAASTAKSQFLSTMSHEIRTPLNAVIGLSGLMINTDLNREQEEFAKTIKRSGENLLHIINNILDFSKIESGNLDVEDIEVRPEELVDEVIDLLTPLSQQKGLDILKEIDETIPDYIRTDGRLVQQVLINLMGNSIKFTEKGHIKVHVRCGKETSKKGNLEFDISDTGIGITEEQSGKLFKQFSQVDASTSRKYGGTGLGLAISKKIVNALGGSIWLDKNTTSGSTFSFSIDYAKSNKKHSPSTEVDYLVAHFGDLNNASPKNSESILIVEDNLVNQVVAAKILERLGLTSDIAQNGSEALEMTLHKKYDVILMDVEMPVMDGLVATQKIREREASTNHRSTIIALTANAMQEDKEKCLAAGMDDFIPKPITIRSVQDTLVKWIKTFKN